MVLNLILYVKQINLGTMCPRAVTKISNCRGKMQLVSGELNILEVFFWFYFLFASYESGQAGVMLVVTRVSSFVQQMDMILEIFYSSILLITRNS